MLKHGGSFGCALTSLVPAGTVVKKIDATLKTGDFLKIFIAHRVDTVHKKVNQSPYSVYKKVNQSPLQCVQKGKSVPITVCNKR